MRVSFQENMREGTCIGSMGDEMQPDFGHRPRGYLFFRWPSLALGSFPTSTAQQEESCAISFGNLHTIPLPPIQQARTSWSTVGKPITNINHFFYYCCWEKWGHQIYQQRRKRWQVKKDHGNEIASVIFLQNCPSPSGGPCKVLLLVYCLGSLRTFIASENHPLSPPPKGLDEHRLDYLVVYFLFGFYNNCLFLLFLTNYIWW